MNSKLRHHCRSIKMRLAETFLDRLENSTGAMQRHLAECPRCRRLARGSARLKLAMHMLKTQPHDADLLMKVNTRAIGVLKHSLRNLPQAEKLRCARPRVPMYARVGKYLEPATRAAACLVILLVVRMGIFTAMTKFQDEGKKAVEKYYARHLDQDMLEDLL